MVTLMNLGAYGGSYNSSRIGFSSFHSDSEAFAAGANHLDLSNLWGTNGFANSLGEAKGNYYSNGGTDGLVRGVQPTIIIKGSYQNGNFITKETIWNWNGNRMSSEGWSLAGEIQKTDFTKGIEGFQMGFQLTDLTTVTPLQKTSNYIAGSVYGASNFSKAKSLIGTAKTLGKI